MIYHSTYEKSYGQPNLLSIDIFPPQQFPTERFVELCPAYWFYMNHEYDPGFTDDMFIERYVRDILYKLDVHDIAKLLDGKILVCDYSVKKVTHLMLVVQWLKTNGYEVQEWR